jgi:hypothetical protein
MRLYFVGLYPFALEHPNSAIRAVLILLAIETITSVTKVTTFRKGAVDPRWGLERCTSSPAPISESRRGYSCELVTAVTVPTNAVRAGPPIHRSEFLCASTRCMCLPVSIWVKTQGCYLACCDEYISDPASELRLSPILGTSPLQSSWKRRNS